jgi:predicted dehydrogenase
MPYRALVFGCGNIGLRYDLGRANPDKPYSHAFALARHAAFELVGLCDLDAARRAEASAAFPHVPCFASGAAALAETKADVAMIATPAAVRLELIEAALDAGARAIFCEKPLALTSDEAKAIRARCRSAAAVLSVNYSRRFDSGYVSIAARILAGEFGALRGGSGRYVRGLDNNGAHMLDLLDWWLGPLRLVAAFASEEARSPHVQVRTQARKDVFLHAVPGESYDLFELELFFDRVAVRISDHGARLSLQFARPLGLGGDARGVLGPAEEVPVNPDGAMLAGLDNLQRLIEADPERREALGGQALNSAVRVSELFESALDIAARQKTKSTA